MATSFIKQSLSDGEDIIFMIPIDRVFWSIRWLECASMLVCSVIVGVFFKSFVVAAIVFALIAPFVIYHFLTLYARERGITTRRIILKTGVIARRTEEMVLYSVETVSIQQSVWGRIFDYGQVEIKGRGETVIVIDRIPTPIEYKRQIDMAIPHFQQNATVTQNDVSAL